MLLMTKVRIMVITAGIPNASETMTEAKKTAINYERLAVGRENRVCLGKDVV